MDHHHPQNPSPSDTHLSENFDNYLPELEFSDFLLLDHDGSEEDFSPENMASSNNVIDRSSIEPSGAFLENSTTRYRSEVKKSKADGARCRAAFRTKSKLEIMDDGFEWRKYGKKMVKNNPNPRNYYQCASGGCNVKKRVERDSEDPSYVITTYDGVHNHESPCVVYYNQTPLMVPNGWTLQPPPPPYYSDSTMSISNMESASCPASEGGDLLMEDLADEVSHSSDEELLEEISLKKLKETPSDPQDLEDLNCDPTEVPSTSSHHFSILHMLDLSYTEIKSLPQSICRLAALQKLFLRNCALLTELPPEIGELTNLEVLDLEGTEILCLPREIAKLVKLTCFKVSFDGYANQTIIPRRVLSNLSRLKELIIDVSPYGEWWDVEVEAIIDDLCNLKELRSLKLYLPTAKLLEDLRLIFPGLANFRFTVGRHEEHFISRLPRDVEDEFNNWEKLEKGLKFINGNHIPNEITKVLKHANAFFLQRHWTAESLFEFGHENLNEVKFFLVMECNEYRTIIDSEKFYQGKDGRDESEAILLGSLERLIIRYMKNMVSFWKGPVGKGSLTNLKFLALHTCPNLTTLFTFDMLNNLRNLEELIVEDCPKIISLVSLRSSDPKSDVFLRSLKKISLFELPELVGISNGLRIAPVLERMIIFYCPKLGKLSTTEVSSTELKVIKAEKEWWDALKWYESDLSTEHEDYLARLFIPLRRDGDLMAQLAED